MCRELFEDGETAEGLPSYIHRYRWSKQLKPFQGPESGPPQLAYIPRRVDPHLSTLQLWRIGNQ